ncbi:MAG: error-prone DNA polymerase [Hahellaceae bacterium]|nr:error-prone DNA polymerase [Hahellaceae bacterium]MCP5169693.1 error-prone DNA polymerase [Hahellaceae bacterium]
MTTTTTYCELHCLSNFTFLRGASHPEELVEQALALGYQALAITDECTLAGVVRAHVAARGRPLKLLIGSEIQLSDRPLKVILLAPDRSAYAELCELITLGRRRSEKGHYCLYWDDLISLKHCLVLWPFWSNLSLPATPSASPAFRHQQQHCLTLAKALQAHFSGRLWLLEEQLLRAEDGLQRQLLQALVAHTPIPATCGNDVHMHTATRQPLQDTLTAIRLGHPLSGLGSALYSNRERYLRPLSTLARLYSPTQRDATCQIAARCRFSLDELRYEYPQELVPPGVSATFHLRQRVEEGALRRFPDGVPDPIREQIETELALIRELHFEPYFLTIEDIVSYARQQQILCQGRGSAANSVVCYCLGITEVDPTQVTLLFERFISRERNEPPDIDVDFEHERREEVIQYIYRRYGRDRAALAATVITYRGRSAIRDVGKALGLDSLWLDQLLSQIDWRSKTSPWRQQLQTKLTDDSHTTAVASHLLQRVEELLGFPRHLSQHVGGFIISAGPLSQLVPVENAAMNGRTVIQWDKDDLEALGLLKVDILALGMLSAIRKALAIISRQTGRPFRMQDIPREDPSVYRMLQNGDSVGVFQVESRAQMNMLPRLKPANYYDLVIEVAIVRPGPIQGDMVHPYLRRRQGLESVDYPNEAIQQVLERTLGVPIFQEQVIKLAMVAAGFSAGEADQLRRAMAAWKRQGKLQPFQDKLISGMTSRGHSLEFAERICRQISGFGEYGFPESHAASFALLVYISAWLKHHQPEAFFCSLLNSQPMGFYSPSQLVQQARRQHVTVLPIDINYSQWDHQIEDRPLPSANARPAIRLGLRLVKGLSRRAAHFLCDARPANGFRHLSALTQATTGLKAPVTQADLEALASANALQSLAGHRYQARWEMLAVTSALPPLFNEPTPRPEHTAPPKFPDRSQVHLPAPDESAALAEDFASTGLTLARHPLELLRSRGLLTRCLTAQELTHCTHGQLVRVAGWVVGRQRPGSATGVTFVTLEDETGNINVVVWQATADAQRSALLSARLLQVTGFVEREAKVIHVIAGKLCDLSSLAAPFQIHSRDFH